MEFWPKKFSLKNVQIKWRHIREFLPLFSATAVLIFVSVFYFFIFKPAKVFPVGSVVTVPEGTTLTKAAKELHRLGVIRSPLVFRGLVTFLRGDGGVIAGDYFFSRPWNIWEISKKITSGEYGLLPVRITILEGATTFEIAELYEKKFGRFDKEKFLELAKEKEGYLFPDTYYFLPNVRAEQVVSVMEKQFYAKVDEVREEIETFGKPLKEIVTMASLLEKEARRLKTRRMISGILWNRININMLLQVDAVFLYINGKNTYELTFSDLRDNNSPYNTYKYKGLPPGPITNPGLSSILAAVTPTESDYLFYLADYSGNTYYSKTFEEHKRYKQRYVY